MPVLEIKHLSKRFQEHQVIDHVNLCIPQHCIYGFLGANGAGKTTTMKMITGLLPADEGEIYVCGKLVSYGKTDVNRFIGYLPDVPAFYDYMKPREYLRLCGEITGLSPSVIKERSDTLLALVGLADIHRNMKGFSRGMKQRLGIAQALLHEPKLLICDEPTSALDPIGRKELLDILNTVKEKTTVLFSTHILSDVERICDHVAILHQGHIVVDGELSELKGKHHHDTLYIEFSSVMLCQTFLEQMKDYPFIQKITQDHASCQLLVSDLEKSKAILLQEIVAKQFPILHFEVLEPTLESLFMEVVV